MKEPVVIDIETGATDPWNGRLLCLGWAGSHSSDCHDGGSVPKSVWEAVADPETPFISHSTFDPRFLLLDDHNVTGPYYDTRRIAHLLDENTPLDLEWLVKHWCGVTMDKRLHQRNKQVWFTSDSGQTLLLTEAYAKWPEQVRSYCRRDCEAEYQLYETLRGAMDQGLWTRYWLEEEVPYTEVLVGMETAGIPINLKKAEVLKKKLHVQVAAKEKELFKDIGYEFNLGSGDQLAQVLFQEAWWQEAHLRIPDEHKEAFRKPYYNKRVKEGLDPAIDFDMHKAMMVDGIFMNTEPDFVCQKIGRDIVHGHILRKGFGWKATPPTPKGKRPSTSTPDLMVHHADKSLVLDLVEHRKLEKVISTYLETYPLHSRDDRVYGRFNQAGTVTGRLSSSEPNLMNQPRRGELGKAIRSLFEGNLIVGDHSQLESRLAAHFSMDPTLLEVYRNNEDIYLRLAHFIFGGHIVKADTERDLCKTLWLGSQYGAFAKTLARTMCLNGFYTSESDADGYLKELRSWVPTLFKYKDYVHARAREKGYVKTIGGRYRRLNAAFHSTATWKMQARGERQAFNAEIQGSAADILRRNMLDCRLYPLLLLAQVHDELLWEYGPDIVDGSADKDILAVLKKTCEAPGYKLDVPLVFEPVFCNSWAEKDGPVGLDLELEEEAA